MPSSLQAQTAANSAPGPAAGKSCGTCTACCKITGVRALQKPPGVYCPHCAIGHGCKNYSERPDDCRDFMCGWILNSHLGADLKPDQCHVVLMWLHETRKLAAVCDPDWPDAWRASNVINVLRQAAIKLDSEWRVVATDGKRSWLITAHAIVTENGETIPFAKEAVDVAR